MRRNEITRSMVGCQPNSRHGNATKTILITLAIIFGLGFLLCAGTGVAVFVYVKKNLENLAITDPVKVRSVLAELIDISVPTEFVPQHATSIFGMTSVTYQWCPTGTCPMGSSSTLTFHSLGSSDTESTVPTNTDDHIKLQFVEFTKEEHEFDIRGKKCIFTFVLGDTRIGYEEEIEESENPKGTEVNPAAPTKSVSKDIAADDPASPNPSTVDDPSAVPTDQDRAEKAPATPEEKGPKMWWINGKFPCKKGICTMDLHLKPEDYNEEKILSMIRSIH